MSAVAKKRYMPQRREAAPVLSLEQVRSDLSSCKTQEEVAQVESKARLLAAWAAELKTLLGAAATEEELVELEAEIARLQRTSGEAMILAAARRGELLPAKGSGGRGKTVTPGVTVSRQQVSRLRRIAEAAPTKLTSYVRACVESGSEVTRKGFLQFLAANKKSQERARERADVADLVHPDQVAGEPDPGSFDDPTGTDPFQVAADGVLQAAKRLEVATRAEDGVWGRMRDEALGDMRRLAANLVDQARARREAGLS